MGDILVPVVADVDADLDRHVPVADNTPDDPPALTPVAARIASGVPHRRCDPPWVDIRLAKNPQDALRELLLPATELHKRHDPDPDGEHLTNRQYSGL